MVRERIKRQKEAKRVKELEKMQPARQEGEPVDEEDPEVLRMRDLRERDEFSERLRCVTKITTIHRTRH